MSLAPEKNAVIAQSGGPTAVINNSIRGAIDTLRISGRVSGMYAAKMGILGVLQEDLLDITAQHPGQIALLEKTPSAGVFGSCRYKIKSSADLDRILEVFSKHKVGYFFYCGGNDSMDTAARIDQAARAQGLDLVCAGIVKTIDNDVGGGLQPDGTFAVCDHDPGYGSTIRSVALNILEANEENKASYTSDPVLVIGVLGRRAGFTAAGARLADPQRKLPLVLVLPEAFLRTKPEENLEFITRQVNAKLADFGRCIVVINESVNLGDLDILRDSFGHEQFSASGRTVEQVLANYLNGLDRKDGRGRAVSRLQARGIARFERPGTRQRRETGAVSAVDLAEAWEVGAKAARLALENESGFMATIIRMPGAKYQVSFGQVPLQTVANAERKFPEEWITGDRIDVRDDFINWALPLIGAPLPEFAAFDNVVAPKICGQYVPFAYRS